MVSYFHNDRIRKQVRKQLIARLRDFFLKTHIVFQDLIAQMKKDVVCWNDIPQNVAFEERVRLNLQQFLASLGHREPTSRDQISGDHVSTSSVLDSTTFLPWASDAYTA
jgi:hypothetical protein